VICIRVKVNNLMFNFNATLESQFLLPYFLPEGAKKISHETYLVYVSLGRVFSLILWNIGHRDMSNPPFL
jgi:hypothetical protein